LVARPFTISNGVATFSSTDSKPVIRTVTFSDKPLKLNNEEPVMDPKKKADADKPLLTLDSAIELLESKGFAVNQKDEQAEADLSFYRANKATFDAAVQAETDRLSTLRNDIVANSDLSDEDVKDMPEAMLNKMGALVTKKKGNETDHSIQGASINTGTLGDVTTNSKAPEVDYSDPEAFAK